MRCDVVCDVPSRIAGGMRLEKVISAREKEKQRKRKKSREWRHREREKCGERA